MILQSSLDFNPIINILYKIGLGQGVIALTAFIPKQYKKEQFTIRMEQEMLSRVDALAAYYHLSRSEFIVQCVQFAMEHMVEQEE